jgi:Bacterial extracellular solute-binding protein
VNRRTLPAPGAQRRRLGLTAAAAGAAIAMPALLGCSRASAPQPIRFWAMGREGEVLDELLAPLSREAPDLNWRIERIPWSAAHEKLLTAFAGDATPDIAQLGNTWIAEMAAIGALEPLDRRAEAEGFRASAASGKPTASTAPCGACRGTWTRGCCSIAATCSNAPVWQRCRWIGPAS